MDQRNLAETQLLVAPMDSLYIICYFCSAPLATAGTTSDARKRAGTRICAVRRYPAAHPGRLWLRVWRVTAGRSDKNSTSLSITECANCDDEHKPANLRFHGQVNAWMAGHVVHVARAGTLVTGVDLAWEGEVRRMLTVVNHE